MSLRSSFCLQHRTDTDSSHCTLDNITGKYLSHYTVLDNSTMGQDIRVCGRQGLVIDGHHNTIRNSTLRYSAGNAFVAGYLQYGGYLRCGMGQLHGDGKCVHQQGETGVHHNTVRTAPCTMPADRY